MPARTQVKAEPFVDAFGSELCPDRVWPIQSKLVLAIVEWVAWFDVTRLRESPATPAP